MVKVELCALRWLSALHGYLTAGFYSHRGEEIRAPCAKLNILFITFQVRYALCVIALSDSKIGRAADRTTYLKQDQPRFTAFTA